MIKKGSPLENSLLEKKGLIEIINAINDAKRFRFLIFNCFQDVLKNNENKAIVLEKLMNIIKIGIMKCLDNEISEKILENINIVSASLRK